jgi:hypothetical protein
MKTARILLPKGGFVKYTGYEDRLVRSRQFATREESQAFLRDLEKQLGVEGLSFCCPHGQCRAIVHFREASSKTKGSRLGAKPQSWVSNRVKDHIPGCEGPVTFDFQNLPHNNLSIDEAASIDGEVIIIHLNIETGERRKLKGSFSKHIGEKNEALEWRRNNPKRHSYFSASSLQELSRLISRAFEIGSIAALKRIKIVHEAGQMTPLKEFIIRNRAKDRLALKSELIKRTPAHWEAKVHGPPRLVMLEMPEQFGHSVHPNHADRVRGFIYPDGRKNVRDQFYLGRTDLTAASFYPHGALILATPFVYPKERGGTSYIHWNVESAENIDMSPDMNIEQILCWKGMRRPNAVCKPRNPQGLHPTK